MEPFAAPERGPGVRTVLIAAVVSAAVTGAIYLVTRPESTPRPGPPRPAAAPVVPGDGGAAPGAPGTETPQRGGLLREVLRQVRAQLTELRARLKAEEDPAVREALRAQIRALRQATRQLEQQIAASGA